MSQSDRLAALALRIGRRLKALRTVKGLTLEDLASAVGVTKGYLSLVENGIRRPSLEVLDRLAGALDVDIKDLL